MVVALDTNVLVHLIMEDTSEHQGVRATVQTFTEAGTSFGLCQQVLYEFLHVSTDRRRFPRPLEMGRALQITREFWRGPDVRRLSRPEHLMDRVVELMEEHQLGRKRILDTALAATLEANDVRRLLTSNDRDFRVFPFLDPVVPGDRSGC